MALLPTVLLSSLVGAVIGGAFLLLRGKNRATPIPFGPFLASAGWLVMMFGHGVVGAYLGLFTGHR